MQPSLYRPGYLDSFKRASAYIGRDNSVPTVHIYTYIYLALLFTCPFNTNTALASQATSLVINTEKGFIFINRYIVDIYPVYRDSIHDFGIFKFDFKAIKYILVTLLELRPNLACNNTRQKLSILSSVISRLDRNAPDYREGYNNFTAVVATGSSSGSPVINKNEFIWIFQPFDKCWKLGLSNNWEALIRFAFPKETGILIVKVVLPKEPADKKIKEGDLLININSSILNSSVGGKVLVLVQHSGKDINIELNVKNLYNITPNQFVSVTSLLQSINHKDTPNLDAFIEVIKEIPNCTRVVVIYKYLYNLHIPITSTITIKRHCVITSPVSLTTLVTRKANFVRIDIKLNKFLTVRKVSYSLVLNLCNILLTITDSIIINTKVEFMHPLQNYAIIRYNPALIDTPVKTPKLVTEFVKQEEETIFFGFNKNLRPLVIKTVVTDITTISVPSRPAGGVEYTLGLVTPIIEKVKFHKVDSGHNSRLEKGDIILTLNDIAVVCKGEELLIKVPTVSIEDLETDRVKTIYLDIYISNRAPGSPSDIYNLEPTNFLIYINGVLTFNLTFFLKKVKKIVVTMKKTEHYFPTTKCIKDLSKELG
ncbi:hypothetical protein K432DRAFT_470900 [Lepidopterella palustris CBS 459.81]|uniref:PDZ domain-containing protein n=1 Tax=Lepidopterella palustris CBS 459.81 TaxID=1314670 RepID=A0A8E2DYS1_9PEZI|nr:hypothetical protein K432DRAFT_470900 [Lepidopterella palustris CBS 459.81]